MRPVTIIRGEKQTKLRDQESRQDKTNSYSSAIEGQESDRTVKLSQCEQAGYQRMVELVCHKYLVGDVVPLSRQWQILYGNRTSQASEMMSLVSFAASQNFIPPEKCVNHYRS